MRRQGMTDPSLVMVTPEKPALQPERVSSLSGDGLNPERTPARGSPDATSKDGVSKASALSYAVLISSGASMFSNNCSPLPQGTRREKPIPENPASLAILAVSSMLAILRRERVIFALTEFPESMRRRAPLIAAAKLPGPLMLSCISGGPSILIWMSAIPRADAIAASSFIIRQPLVRMAIL